MTSSQKCALAARSFRAGAGYELVAYDRLAPEEAVVLAELRANADFYGILRPVAGSGRTIRAVDRDTALLWLGARSPGALPFFVWEGPRESAHRRVAQLVLDGVLEVEHDGTFVSGARALPAIVDRSPEVEGGRASELALAALRHGQMLELRDPAVLAARLYRHGAIPLSPRWVRRAGDTAQTRHFLGIAHTTSLARLLRERFSEVAHNE